jgi:hypothetical protein
MGTSLAWRTDAQLHDAVRLQLDEDPAIRAHDIAVVRRRIVRSRHRRAARPAPPGAAWRAAHQPPDIDGLPIAGCDSFALVPQHLVGRRRSISGNHLEGLGGFRRARQAVEQVEQPGINLVNLFGAEVTQEMIHGRQGVRQITCRRW